MTSTHFLLLVAANLAFILTNLYGCLLKWFFNAFSVLVFSLQMLVMCEGYFFLKTSIPRKSTGYICQPPMPTMR